MGAYVAGLTYIIAISTTNLERSLWLFVGIIPIGLALLWPSKIAPRFATLVPLRAGEVVEFPVEAFQAQLATDAAGWREFSADMSKANSARPWVCLKCHETNPGSFEKCWKCTSDDTTVA